MEIFFFFWKQSLGFLQIEFQWANCSKISMLLSEQSNPSSFLTCLLGRLLFSHNWEGGRDKRERVGTANPYRVPWGTGGTRKGRLCERGAIVKKRSSNFSSATPQRLRMEDTLSELSRRRSKLNSARLTPCYVPLWKLFFPSAPPNPTPNSLPRRQGGRGGAEKTAAWVQR